MYTGSDPINPSVSSVTSHRSCYQSDRQQSSVLRVLSIMYEISHCQASTQEKHTKP